MTNENQNCQLTLKFRISGKRKQKTIVITQEQAFQFLDAIRQEAIPNNQ